MVIFPYIAMTISTQLEIGINPKPNVAPAVVLNVLGRLWLISTLSRAETHVSGLAQRLEISPAVVSQQLRILRSATSVDFRTVDGRAMYRIIEPLVDNLLQWMGSYRDSGGVRGKS